MAGTYRGGSTVINVRREQYERDIDPYPYRRRRSTKKSGAMKDWAAAEFKPETWLIKQGDK